MKKFILSLLFFIILPSNLLALERVSLQLDWLHQFQFAGYYMAKEKGFYEENGLDVVLKEYRGGLNLVEDVLSSRSNYAVGKASLIISKLEGKHIVLLSAIFQNSPMMLISLDSIKEVGDLKGKKITLTNDAKLMASINAMLIAQGIKHDDVKYQPHSFRLEDLIEGKTDAMACFLSNEPYLLEKKGIKYTVHNPADYGFNFYGGILFTSQKELENNPSRVKKFNEASLKGWKYAFENIEETAKIIFKKYNTQNKSLDAFIFEGKMLKKVSEYNEKSLGKIDIKKIEELKRIYLLLSIKNSFKPDITNLIYDPNSIVLTKEEKNYLKNNTITLLSNNTYPPLAFKDKNNKFLGIEIDYWRLINKKLKNKKYKIKKIIRSKDALKIMGKDKNSVKYSFSKLDNNDTIHKSDTIFTIPIAVVTLKDKPFVPDILELENKKIAIYKRSSFYPILKRKYPNLEFIEVKSVKEGLNLVTNNNVWGVVGKLPRLSYLINKNHYLNLKISSTFDEKYQLKYSINKENKLLKSIINKTILTITPEEKKTINKKYYSVIYETSFDYLWFYRILLPLILVIIIITIINEKLKKEIQKRKEVEKQLNKIANMDTLTNSYNRRKIEEIFENEITRIKRYNRDLSIIFIDIDDFKKINDKFGHKIGDKVLTKVSRIIKKHIRKIDYFGRWGGEEFIIILPETKKEQARNVAIFIKEIIAGHDFKIGQGVTCSFGVSEFEDNDTASTLLTRADNAMYYVKKTGKNGVKVI